MNVLKVQMAVLRHARMKLVDFHVLVVLVIALRVTVMDV